MHVLKRMKKQEPQENTSTAPCLHEDLIFNILSNIPAALLQDKFKFVSKQWLNIILNPAFIQSHMLRSETDGGVLQVCNDLDGDLILRLIDLKANQVCELHRFPEDFLTIGTRQSFCNGLILCRNLTPSSMFLMNPTTRETLALRPPEIKSGIFCDLIYVSCTKKYKVIILDTGQNVNCLGFYIHTIGDCTRNPWRRIEGPTFDTSCLRRRSVNGVLYISSYSERILVAVDAKRETIGHVPAAPRGLYNVRIFKMRDALSLSGKCSTKCTVPFEIWSLKDNDIDGRGLCWVKQFVVTECPIDTKASRGLWVVGSSSNGEVIVIQHDFCELFTYHVKTRRWNCCNTVDKTRFLYASAIHSSSLVSPRCL